MVTLQGGRARPGGPKFSGRSGARTRGSEGPEGGSAARRDARAGGRDARGSVKGHGANRARLGGDDGGIVSDFPRRDHRAPRARRRFRSRTRFVTRRTKSTVCDSRNDAECPGEKMRATVVAAGVFEPRVMCAPRRTAGPRRVHRVRGERDIADLNGQKVAPRSEDDDAPRRDRDTHVARDGWDLRAASGDARNSSPTSRCGAIRDVRNFCRRNHETRSCVQGRRRSHPPPVIARDRRRRVAHSAHSRHPSAPRRGVRRTVAAAAAAAAVVFPKPPPEVSRSQPLRKAPPLRSRLLFLISSHPTRRSPCCSPYPACVFSARLPRRPVPFRYRRSDPPP